jgi:hypothetical protein
MRSSPTLAVTPGPRYMQFSGQIGRDCGAQVGPGTAGGCSCWESWVSPGRPTGSGDHSLWSLPQTQPSAREGGDRPQLGFSFGLITTVSLWTPPFLTDDTM